MALKRRKRLNLSSKCFNLARQLRDLEVFLSGDIKKIARRQVNKLVIKKGTSKFRMNGS